MLESAFLAVIVIGLLHGLEPAHGWPVAFLYSSRTEKPFRYGLISSTIISVFHFISSIVVVLVYVLISGFIAFPSQLMKFLGAAALVAVGLKFFFEEVEDQNRSQHGHLHENTGKIDHEHEHEHPDIGKHTHQHKHAKRVKLTMYGLAVFAFVLGFAHEEEFALLGLAVGGIDPLLLMISYALSVTASLVAVTLACIKAYCKIEDKIGHYERFIPKVNALVLFMLAAALVLGLA